MLRWRDDTACRVLLAGGFRMTRSRHVVMTATMTMMNLRARGLCTTTPPGLTGQIEVDAVGAQWADVWQASSTPLPVPGWWPHHGLQCPPPLTVEQLRSAAATFPVGTGLGWDKLHPRVVCRCPDAALQELGRILEEAERTGHWPTATGPVLVVLIPKPDGGRRPIGLLPLLIRWWMRARLASARLDAGT